MVAHGGPGRGRAAHGRGGRKSSAAGHDVRDLAAVDAPREALVEVGVTGEDRVGPQAGLVADASMSLAMTGEPPWTASKDTGG